MSKMANRQDSNRPPVQHPGQHFSGHLLHREPVNDSSPVLTVPVLWVRLGLDALLRD